MNKGYLKQMLPYFSKVYHLGEKINSLKVAAIDDVELFESTKKCCDECLTRVDKVGNIHYFHRSVVCSTVCSDPHIILGQEMIEPKRDSSNKDVQVVSG